MPFPGKASPAGPVLPEARVRTIARDPTWLKLLHYDHHGQRSEIVSEEFFLSAAGKTDATAELQATLTAYFEPWPNDTNLHPRCRFPARYFWLSRQFDLPGYVVREPRCQHLEKWASLNGLRSASLLLVSGYLGNPASTFGHALLRLNTGEADAGNMLDATINYGAAIPQNELMARYVYRGLFGGYQAGFSGEHFYTEDLMYTRTELRDMWEYELNLADDQLKLLTFHLWEVLGRRFKYYFLTQNCAYRMAELLELATDESFLINTRLWYAPVEMFHRLHALDAVRPGRLIRSIRFIPSSQRELMHQFAALTPSEATVVKSIVHDAAVDLPVRLAAFSVPRQLEVIDALLAYYQYRLVAEGSNPNAATRATKDTVLRERLRLPARSEPNPQLPARPSPAERSAPMLTAVGLGMDVDGQPYARAQVALFSYEQVGMNGLDTGELVVLDIAGGADNKQRAILDHFDVIRVRKLNTNRLWTGEDSWSWQTRVGASRVRRNDRDHIDSSGSFGVGRAAQWGENVTAYAMVDASLQAGPSPFSGEPNLGLIAGAGRWKSWVQTGARYDVNLGQWRYRMQAAVHYHLTQHRALQLELVRDAETRRAVLSFHQYW